MSPELTMRALLGEVLTSIEGAREGSGDVVFDCESGKRFLMPHYQDCCETVAIHKVTGDIASILGSPVTLANENFPELPPPECPDSYTWSEYTIETAKGKLVILWLGESNGYYGEGVDFQEVQP